MNYSILFNQYCESLARKLTSLRKEVLYVLWCEKKPLKAYDILNNLLKIKPNSTPPTVYRALAYFEAKGIVHKIESIQCYTLCREPEKHLPSELLMVCNDCHQVVEVYDEMMHELVARLAVDHCFKLNQDTIELNGICQMCL